MQAGEVFRARGACSVAPRPMLLTQPSAAVTGPSSVALLQSMRWVYVVSRQPGLRGEASACLGKVGSLGIFPAELQQVSSKCRGCEVLKCLQPG